MDLLDLAILALRIALVALLYLFLWLVVRGTLGSFTRKSSPSRASITPEPSAALVLTVLEPGESTLRPGERIEVRAVSVIGRAAAADFVVDDAAVSAQHARLDWSTEGWRVADLGSTNGTLLNDRAVGGATRLRRGDRLAVGPVRFEVSDT